MNIYNSFKFLRARSSLILLLCSGSFAVTGQVLTLYDAVKATEAHHPLIRQRQLEVSASKAHTGTVGNNRLPALTLEEQLTAGTDNALYGGYFSLGVTPSTPGTYNQVHNSPNAGNTAIALLKWEVFNFGYYNAQKNEALSQVAVAQANLSSGHYQLTTAVVNLYLDWLTKYRLMQVTRLNVERSEVFLQYVKAHVLSGLKAGTDSSLAQSALSGAKIAYLEAQNRFNADKITIGNYSGLPPVGLLPDTAISGLISGLLTDATPDSIPGNHPLLEVYQLQYEAQLAANRTISRKYMPKVGLLGTWWIRNSGISPSGVYPNELGYGMPYSRENYLAGVNITWNVFDLKRVHNELAEGLLYAEAKLNAAEDQSLQLNNLLQQANAAYQSTIDKLHEIPIQLLSARQAYEQQTALFRAGLNTLVDVTNAQFQLQQAESAQVITENDLLQLLMVRNALGSQNDQFIQLFNK